MPATYRILAIDDDPVMLAIIMAALRHEPAFVVAGCGNGEDGLALATTFLPDLILCDVSMPGLDGHAVLERLRADGALAAIAFIFMTARAEPADIEAMLASGAAEVIIKPFKLPDVLRVVRRELFMPDAADGELQPAAYDFKTRLRNDAVALRQFRLQLTETTLPDGLKDCVHRLAGAAGIYGFDTISTEAAAAEHAIACFSGTDEGRAAVSDKLQQLINHVERHAGL